MALEDRFQTTLDEAAYAEVKTVGDLHLLVAERSAAPRGATTARCTLRTSRLRMSRLSIGGRRGHRAADAGPPARV